MVVEKEEGRGNKRSLERKRRRRKGCGDGKETRSKRRNKEVNREDREEKETVVIHWEEMLQDYSKGQREFTIRRAIYKLATRRRHRKIQDEEEDAVWRIILQRQSPGKKDGDGERNVIVAAAVLSACFCHDV